MKNIFKKINPKTFLVFFVVFALMNSVIIPKYVNGEEITIPRIVIGIVVSLIAAFFISLTAKPKSS